MKSFIAFFLSLLMAFSAFAADVTGSITLLFSSNRNYNVVIDGQTIYSNNRRVRLNNIHPGRHNIEVYSTNRSIGRNRRPVYASSFIVKPRYDVFIQIDYNGHVQFSERKSLDEKRLNKKGKHNKGKGKGKGHGSNDYKNDPFKEENYNDNNRNKWEENRNSDVTDYE